MNLSDNYMQKETSAIFKPIEEDIIAEINSDHICLNSPFWINHNRNQKVPVILTKKYLTLCQKGVFLANVYLFYVDLDFDLKFQIIYESNQSHPNYANNTMSAKKIGFRLLKKNYEPVELEIAGQNMIQIWIKQLTRCVSQRQFLKHFKLIRRIGRGANAFVYEVERLTDNKHFAVKTFLKKHTINSLDPQKRLAFINEINIMRSLNNPNIIKLKGMYESQNQIHLVLQQLPVGLHHLINKREARFSPTQIKEFVMGMAKALKHMHDNRIMHRDLKPDNIMMRSKDSMSPVIIDFGLSANSDSDDYIFYKSGSPGYIAPEIFTLQKGMKIQPVCDVFSLGVIFHIFLTRQHLFAGESQRQILVCNHRSIFNWSLQIYNDVEPKALNLLKKMLKKDPIERITAAEMLDHPYLKDDVHIKGPISPPVTEVSKKYL